MNQSTIKKLSLTVLATLCCGAAFAGALTAPQWKHTIVPMRLDAADAPAAAPIYTNLQTDTCTSCNYSADNGFLVLGPTNCFIPGATQWLAYPFWPTRTAAPRQANVAVTLDADLCSNGANKFTCAIYDDACGGPNTLLVSATGTAPAGPCLLALVKFRSAPVLTLGQKYWLVVTTAPGTQDAFTGVWWEVNHTASYVNFNDGNGWQFSPNASPGAFSIN